ncbi:MAG: hypothetical protein WBN80_06475 [Prochlorococcaceae cyanobacterium]
MSALALANSFALAAIAAEAEGLQVAEVVGAALALVSTRTFTEPLIGVRWRPD